MARNFYNEMENLPEEGAFLIRDNGIVNYGERWAYGYAVPIRELKTGDLKRSTLFLKTTDQEDAAMYTLANHVDSTADATQIAKQRGQSHVYGFREHAWLKTDSLKGRH